MIRLITGGTRKSLMSLIYKTKKESSSCMKKKKSDSVDAVEESNVIREIN